jgi:ferredoxin
MNIVNTAQAYNVLQVKPDSTFNEIKYAYRKLVLELHPDKNNEESDGVKFKLVTEAYHALKNNNKASNSKLKEQTNPATKPHTTQWGARSSNRPPEEDWSRYTKQTEQSDPFFWKNYVAEFWKNYESRTSNVKKPYDFETIQEKRNHQDLCVGVDHSRCIGCCSCETIAPTVFSVDKISKMNPKSNVINPKGATTERILDAAQTCPTKAIHVDDKGAGRRLYPY